MFIAVADCGLQMGNQHAETRTANPRSVIRIPCSCCQYQRVVLRPCTRPFAQGYQDFLRVPESTASLEDICYTASIRRSHHDYRLAVMGHSREQLSESLAAFVQGEAHPGLSSGRQIAGRQRQIVFVFPGQGSQWHGMGRMLLEQEPVFRETLERCDDAAAWRLVFTCSTDHCG